MSAGRPRRRQEEHLVTMLMGARPLRGDSPPPRPGSLSVDVDRRFGGVIVTLRGQLDSLTAREVEAVLRELFEGERCVVVVDLFDTAVGERRALAVFGEAAARARANGGTLTLTAPSPFVAGLLEGMGLGGLVFPPPARLLPRVL